MNFISVVMLFLLFDPFSYVKNSKDTSITFPESENARIQLFPDSISSKELCIRKIGRLNPDMDSLVLKSCTSKVHFDAIEDFMRDSLEFRIRYALMLVRDSVLYNFTISDTALSQKEAETYLYSVKKMLMCSDSSCVNSYFNIIYKFIKQ
jgi:hypothetical protein